MVRFYVNHQDNSKSSFLSLFSTTLMYATQYGHVDLVDLLLDLGHEEEVISVVNIHTHD